MNNIDWAADEYVNSSHCSDVMGITIVILEALLGHVELVTEKLHHHPCWKLLIV